MLYQPVLTFEMYDVAVKLKPLQQHFTLVLQLGTSLCTAARSPLSAILFEGRGDYTVHRLVPSCSTIEKSCWRGFSFMATQYISKVKTRWYSMMNKNYEKAPLAPNVHEFIWLVTPQTCILIMLYKIVRPFKRSLFSSTAYIHGAIYAVSTIFASVNEILRCGH